MASAAHRLLDHTLPHGCMRSAPYPRGIPQTGRCAAQNAAISCKRVKSYRESARCQRRTTYSALRNCPCLPAAQGKFRRFCPLKETGSGAAAGTSFQAAPYIPCQKPVIHLVYCTAPELIQRASAPARENHRAVQPPEQRRRFAVAHAGQRAYRTPLFL